MLFCPIRPHIRPDRAVISVGGEGALAFLHNLLTVDLLQKKPGETVYGALLSPQGKILHDVFVFVGDNIVHVDCARSQAEALLQKLKMYRLRARLEIKSEPSLRVAVGQPEGVDDPRVTWVMGSRGIVTSGTLPEGDDGVYERHRIVVGLADSEADIESGKFFVHEANLDYLRAVSFTKGCYVGQEVVSRTHHRGTARNRILCVLNPGGGEITSGEEVRFGEQRLGVVLSSKAGNAIALIRLDRLTRESAFGLNVGGVGVYVGKPQWMNAEIFE
jgi:tRNA-modifying protein YgfZ